MCVVQLGISAPQGCGKSTLVEQLEQLMAWLGVSAASVSIDDFYLTNAQQTALAAANPDNRLLALRGNAGSHDLQLGRDTLQQLKACTAAGSTVPVPRWERFEGVRRKGGCSNALRQSQSPAQGSHAAC
jgi:D-glycerate 3-kinase